MISQGTRDASLVERSLWFAYCEAQEGLGEASARDALLVWEAAYRLAKLVRCIEEGK